VFGQTPTVNEIIQKGNEYYLQNQYEQAVTAYTSALTQEPDNAIAKYNLANALAKQTKQDEAIKMYAALAAATTEKEIKAKSFYNQGAVLSKQKKLEESIEAYKNALRQNPADNDARENLQKALLELKKKNPPKKQDDQQKKKQDQQQKKQQQSKMSPKEAEQRLKLMQQKEKEIQERLQKEKAKMGGSQTKDW